MEGQDMDFVTQAKFIAWLVDCPIQFQRRVSSEGEVSYVFFDHKKGK